MAGRRDFLKRFGIGIAAAPVAVQAAEAALTAPSPKIAPNPEPPKVYDPESFRQFYGMTANDCVTSTACITFNLPQGHFVNFSDRRGDGRYLSGSEMRELNQKARALR